MSDPFARKLADAILEAVSVYNGAVEEWCEKSLVDPEGRGVLLVWDEWPYMYQICLSELVPWAEIYEVRP
jgi:hypothetical protein